MIQAKKKASTVELLFSTARKMGLQPSWITQNGLFVITTKNGEQYVNHERSSRNSEVGASLSRNKYHTRLIMSRHGLPNIPYLRPRSLAQAEDFLAVHKKIIVKPLRGHGAKGIHIVEARDDLAQLTITGSIIEKYIFGKEMRYLVLDGTVIGVHESQYGTSVDEHRDLKRVSYDKQQWDEGLTAMAVNISAILGLSFSAVDYLIDEAGNSYILEVNSRPGFKWFHAPSEGPIVDVAGQFLRAMLDDTTAVPALQP